MVIFMAVTRSRSELKTGLPKETQSLCPECKKVITARVFEENGDVMMEKDSDGFNFAQFVKMNEKFKHVPIILATAVNQRTKFKFSLEKDGNFLPVEKFMEKPIDPDDLIATIKGLLK